MRFFLFVCALLSYALFSISHANSLYSPLDNRVHIPFARFQNVNYQAVLSFVPPSQLLLETAKPRFDNPVFADTVNVADDLSFHLSRINFDGRLYQADLTFQGNNIFNISNLSEVVINQQGRGDILSRILKIEYSITQLKSLVLLFNSFLGLDVEVPDSEGIEIYKVNYQTINPAGEFVSASALVSIPKDNKGSYPLLAYQHPTIVLNAEAPSQLDRDIPSIIAASRGYVTVAADYLGFGEGAGLHPYVHANSLATSIVDALRAARNIAAEKNINLNGQVFLLGYSEGGYATMAAQREIERHYATEFELIASAPMAGPYDLSETMINPFLDDISHPNPFFFPFTVLAYNQVYGLVGQLSDYFQSPYDSSILQLFDGQLDGEQINDLVPGNRDLFTQNLYDELNRTRTPALLDAALYENDVYRWKPNTKTLLYHCVNDNQVYFANTQVAFDHFQALGANQVELNAIEDVGYDIGDVHVNCAIPLLLEGINRFDELKMLP